MSEIKTVSIGIPAHNEAKNIGKLLGQILLQKTTNVKLEKIIVVNDGSTDNTKEIVSHIFDDKIHLINQNRLGKATSLNNIQEYAQSDYLITLDADVLVNGSDFIEKILNPLINNPKIGLLSCKILPTKSHNFISSVVNFSYELKRNQFAKLKNVENVYLCHGRLRAYSKKFYKLLKYPIEVIADDAYSYLDNKKKGFGFHYLENTSVYFASPKTLSDFIKQNKRFTISRKQLELYFDKKFLDEEFKINFSNNIQILLKGFVMNPIYMCFYILMLVISKVYISDMKQSYLWKMAESSKEVVND